VSNFLTQGRQALLAALKADATLSDAVRTWYEWGSGLQERMRLDPAMCPAASLQPAELEEEELLNVSSEFPQDLSLAIVTDGQDAEPCEELVVAALGVIHATEVDALGLASEGCSRARLIRVRWEALATEDAARVRWQAELIVRIGWVRRT
jgi:hypothetical protein